MPIPHDFASLFPPGRVLENHPLGPYTTYRVGGPGRRVLFPHDPDELCSMLRLLHQLGESVHLVLGHGANVLIADDGIDGNVLVLRRMDSWRLENGLLVADAGLAADAAAQAAADAGWSGLEFLAGLPGSLGGAAWMNARAFERDMAGVLAWVDVAGPDGRLARESCRMEDFAYKKSPFMDRPEAIIARVALRLAPGDPGEIAQLMERHRAVRRERGEHRVLSCGCVFKNPATREAPAGRLIDSCGLKGFGTEHAWVYARHANFIVHDGQATAAELRALFFEVQRIVAQRTGILLEPEVRFCGTFKNPVLSFHPDPRRAAGEEDSPCS